MDKITALPLQTRLAALGEADVAARTVEVVWTTGAIVRRRRWDGWDPVPFDEELVVTPEAVNLERLLAGAPVLDSHAKYSTEHQRAVVDNAWIKGGKGYATIRFPTQGTDEASDRLFSLVGQKIIRNLSVGYSVEKMTVVRPEKRDDVERWIVERWTPYELSFVTVPADQGAQTRALAEAGAAERTFPVQIVQHGAGGSFLRNLRLRMAMAARRAQAA